MATHTDAEMLHRLEVEAGILMQIASDGLPAMDIGAWSENKHYYLDRYCYMFAVGTKNKWPRRYYIDLFSGPVERGT